MNSGIYKITNIENNKFYIGSAIMLYKRWSTHKQQLKNNKHHSIILQRAWNKYGENKFIFEIIEFVNPEILILREQYYLDLFNPTNPNIGYNINPIANSQKGRIVSAETRAKISIGNKGKHSKFGKDNPNFGSTRSINTKKKMSKAQSGINNPAFGKFGKYNPCSKQVIQKTLDGIIVKIWDSLSDIGRETGFSVGNISSCCNSMKKSSKGFIWQYKIQS